MEKRSLADKLVLIRERIFRKNGSIGIIKEFQDHEDFGYRKIHKFLEYIDKKIVEEISNKIIIKVRNGSTFENEIWQYNEQLTSEYILKVARRFDVFVPDHLTKRQKMELFLGFGVSDNTFLVFMPIHANSF